MIRDRDMRQLCSAAQRSVATGEARLAHNASRREAWRMRRQGRMKNDSIGNLITLSSWGTERSRWLDSKTVSRRRNHSKTTTTNTVTGLCSSLFDAHWIVAKTLIVDEAKVESPCYAAQLYADKSITPHMRRSWTHTRHVHTQCRESKRIIFRTVISNGCISWQCSWSWLTVLQVATKARNCKLC